MDGVVGPQHPTRSPPRYERPWPRSHGHSFIAKKKKLCFSLSGLRILCGALIHSDLESGVTNFGESRNRRVTAQSGLQGWGRCGAGPKTRRGKANIKRYHLGDREPTNNHEAHLPNHDFRDPLPRGDGVARRRPSARRRRTRPRRDPVQRESAAGHSRRPAGDPGGRGRAPGQQGQHRPRENSSRPTETEFRTEFRSNSCRDR